MVEKRPIPSSVLPMPRMPGMSASGESLTPKEIMGIIRRHVFMIILLTFLGVMVGGVSWYLLLRYLPKYTARTFIEVLPPVEHDPMSVGGATVNKDIQYGYRQSIQSLIRQQNTLGELLSRAKVQETEWFRQLGRTQSGRFQKGYKELEDNLGVFAQRDGSFVVVSMTCGSSKESAIIVNELVSLFIANQGQRKVREAQNTLKMLEGQKKSIEGEITYAQQQLNSVRQYRPGGFADFEENRQWRDTATLRLDNLEVQRDRLVLQISQLQEVINSLQRQATGPIKFQVENQVERDPIMITLGQQLALSQSDLAAKETKFGENHREVRRAREFIREIKAKRQLRRGEIAEQVRQSNLQNAQDQLASLLKQLEDLQKMRNEAEKQKQDYNRNQALYTERKKLIDERQTTLDKLKTRIAAQKMLIKSPETAKVRSVGMAPEPIKVSSPRWELYFPGGTIIGFLLGLGLAFVIELVNDIVRMPRDVSRYLHISLLGVVPDFQEDAQVSSLDLYQVVRQEPYSILSESYRRIRTHLDLSNPQERTKVVLLSSGMPGEGNTSVAVNLALSTVAVGKKVLLIDANFHRPKLGKIFAEDKSASENSEGIEFGLSAFLTGEIEAERIARSSGIEGLDVIDTGSMAGNPAELLGGLKMQELLKLERERYEQIIIDGPPVLLVTDAKLLGSITDGVILVFNASSTHRGAAQRSIRELKEVNARILGGVLFGVKSMKGGYFHEQYKTFHKYQQTVSSAV